MSAKSISFRKSNTNALALQFWPRFFAFILDYSLVAYIVVPFLFIGLSKFIALPEINDYFSQSWKNLSGPYGITLFTLWIYFAGFESSKYRATPGKFLLRYEVTDKKGRRIPLSIALLRFPLKLIAISTLIGVWIIDINKKRQGMHDMLCMTLVRKK